MLSPSHLSRLVPLNIDQSHIATRRPGPDNERPHLHKLGNLLPQQHLGRVEQVVQVVVVIRRDNLTLPIVVHGERIKVLISRLKRLPSIIVNLAGVLGGFLGTGERQVENAADHAGDDGETDDGDDEAEEEGYAATYLGGGLEGDRRMEGWAYPVGGDGGGGC